MFTLVGLISVSLLVGTDDVLVDRDNVRIDHSCRITIADHPIVDADGDGVIHIVGDGITVDFAGQLLLGTFDAEGPDQFTGTGVRVTAQRVTIRNLKVRGFKAGITAQHADALTIEDCDVSGNYRQRLRSTPQAEDGADWLFPHHNDDNQWVMNHGAGIYIQDSDRVTIRRVRAREGQNGIILDSVNDSRLYDNDCSFLSGWGLAMWRSSRNVISRNAFDFCVRGYSHGVYNRGQDSAGILMFEQNNDNIIAENSATHGGDGFFGFGGLEAMGDHWMKEQQAAQRRATGRDSVDDLIIIPPDVIARVHRRGNNRNLLIDNDFSYAVAHGIEMTFSFDNRFIGNRLVEDAICGIWGGYSQDTLIAGNLFEGTGDGAYGLERGGANIEHGRGNRILDNTFVGNRCGVHLWWDEDTHLMASPWAKANDPSLSGQADMTLAIRATGHMLPSVGNTVAGNRFEADQIALHVRDADQTRYADNIMIGVTQEIDSTRSEITTEVVDHRNWDYPKPNLPGHSRPIGARAHLAGREHIIITELGPYDWESPLLVRQSASTIEHVFKVLGGDGVETVKLLNPATSGPFPGSTGPIVEHHDHASITVRSIRAGEVLPYELKVTTTSGGTLHAGGLLMDIVWDVQVFDYHADPREEVAQWRTEAKEKATSFQTASLSFNYGGGGPSQLPDVPSSVRDADLGRDHFGTIATTSITLPPGAWRITTLSDDGIRVWVDDEVVIDEWTWHAPTRYDAQVTLVEPRRIELRVEHFELDGAAALEVGIERVDS